MAEDIPFDVRPEPQKIDVFPANQGVPGQTVAATRSLKFHYALGENSPGVDSIYNSIISGQEDYIRNQQAMEQSLKDKQYQLERLKGYLADHQGPITQQALENFQTLTAPRQPNPKIDMEKEFSSKLIDELYFGDDSIVKQAGLTRETSQFYNVFKDNVVKQEIVKKTVEDTNKDYEKPYSLARKQKSWWDDLLETMVPLKSWIDIASNSDSGKFFLGANLADVVRKGSMMTAEQFEPWFRGQYDAIYAHNPLDAQHFAEAFLSYSTSGENWDTLGNFADLGSLIPTTLAGRGLKSAFKGTSAVLGKMKNFDIPSILASAGRTEDAAKSIVMKDIRQNQAQYDKALSEVTSLDQQGDVKRLLEQVPTFSNPLKFIEGGSLREVPNDVTYGLKYSEEKSSVAAMARSGSEKPDPLQPTYDITRDGKTVGQAHLRISPDGRTITIKGITSLEEGRGTKEVANTFGTTAIRKLLGDLRVIYPNAETIQGSRVSGARPKQANAIISLPPTVKVQSFDNLKIDYAEGPKGDLKVSIGDGVYAIDQQAAAKKPKAKAAVDTTIYRAIRLNGKVYTDPSVTAVGLRKTHADLFPQVYKDYEERFKKLFPDQPEREVVRAARAQADRDIEAADADVKDFGYVVKGKYYETPEAAFDAAEVLKPIKLVKDDENPHKFDIKRGEITIGEMYVSRGSDTKTIFVDEIQVLKKKDYPGPAAIRDLLEQLVEHYPDATHIAGFRVTGARMRPGTNGFANADVKIPLPKKKAPPATKITAGFMSEGQLGPQDVRTTLHGVEVVATPEPNLVREFSNRIGNRLLEQGIPALNGLADRNAVERLSRAAEQTAIDRAVEFARLEYNHLGDGVVDLAHYLPPESNIANIGQVAIYLKRPDALPFPTEEAARMWASTEYKLPTGSYDILNQGNGWHIRVIRPIDETDPFVRNTLIETGNETKRNFLNTFFGNVRSADDVNPIDLRTGRKTAVHSIQDQYRALEQMTQPIRALKGQSKKDFIRFTEALRDYEHQGIRGRFFNTMREMETEWQNMFGHLPNEKEIVAYNAYLRAYEWDYIWRNIGVYRSLTRQGIRDFKITKPDGTLTAAFKGRQVDNIDWHGNHGLLVQGQTPYFARSSQIPAEERNALEVSISNGEYKIIQLAQPQMLPLKPELEINDLIEFVLVKDFQSDRIALNQIPFKPGGHALYDYNHFVKQPRAMWAGDRRIYTHDTTVRPLSFSSDAARLVPLYNEAQRLYRLRDPGFAAYADAHIPEGAARLQSAFEAGDLSTTEPFVAVKRGQSAWNIGEVKNHYDATGGVENYQSSSNNLYQSVNHQYAGERNYDVSTGNGRGSEENPLFRLDRPKYVDPLTTVNRAMATLARNQSLEDFRFLAAEHFAQEFQGALAAGQDQLRSNPIAALFQPKWNESAPRDLLQAAKHYQRSFVDFMHVQSDWGKNVGWLKERIYEWVSHRIGETRTDAIANSKLIKAIQDPIHTVRSLAFVEHLGLFNPMQYFKQLQTLTHLTGIAGPVVAGKSVPVAYLMRALMMTAESPAHVAHFAKMAVPFGWTPESFQEAYQALRRTGLDIVEGEHAWKDDLSDPDLFTGKFSKFLNKTTFFFKEGERQTRISAFNAAYLQWRQANPTATLDRRALQYILTRQDIMNGNMTRASNAAWQSMGGGVLSVPLQFATYPIRIMEQFMSSRLTSAERMRLIMTYSLMYGIPVGVGITPLGVYPWYQDLTQHLLENGIVDDPNPVVETLHKGLIEMMFHMIGGKEYAAGESLGVGGLQITKDMFNGQFMEVALGAAGSAVGGILESTVPLYHDLAGIFYDGVDGKGPLIAGDFMDIMRNASSVNSAYKMYYALAYGKYVSRGETYVDQMTPIDAIFSTIFGVNPQSFDNLSREIDSMKDQKAMQDYAEKQMIKYIRRGLQTDFKDDKTREAYFRQAQAWRVLGDFQYDQFPKILQRALQGIEPLAGQVNNSYFWKNAPASQMKAREEALIKQLGAKPPEPPKVPLPPPQTKLPSVLGIRG